jgi:hypothetical protein
MLSKIRGSLFFACFGTQLLIVFPISLAGRLYIDDLGRSAEGYLGWSGVGRPIADALFYIANLGSPAVDVFPLNQIFAAGFIALAGVLLANIFRLERPLAVAVATLPLGGQPYFLENLSYSFDSLTMSAGLVCSVIASYLVVQKRGSWPVIVSSLMIFITLCLYQQAVTAFYLIIVIVIASQPSSREHVFSVVTASFFASTIAVLLYKLLVTIPPGGYGAKSSTLWPFSEFPEGILENLTKYWMLLYDHWGHSVFGVCALLVIVVGIHLATRSFSARRTTLNYYVAYPLTIVALGLSVCLSFGISLLIKDVHFFPRFFIGVGVILSLFNLIILQNTSEAISQRSDGYTLAFLFRTPVFFLAYTLVVVAFAYGRASALQKEFEMSFLTRLVHDIDISSLSVDMKSIGFIGTIPMAPTLKNTGKKFPVVLSLVPRHVENDWVWGRAQMKYFGLSLEYIPLPVETRSLATNGSLPSLFKGMDYELYRHDDVLVVYFR